MYYSSGIGSLRRSMICKHGYGGIDSKIGNTPWLATERIMRQKIKVLKETPDYLVISKPAGISVHPGAGEEEFTITDWLQEKYPSTKNLAWKTKVRIGIVHRLDKDTSGVLLLAKNPEALDYFQDQFREHKIEKHYTTLVFGAPPQEQGTVDAFLSRDPRDRERQKVDLVNFGLDERERKFSATRYKVLRKFKCKGWSLALLDVVILTGRKHQIRAHMKHLGYPVLGDPKYFTKPARRLAKQLELTRQFLHATSLKFKEFPSGKITRVSDDLPDDLNNILNDIQ